MPQPHLVHRLLVVAAAASGFAVVAAAPSGAASTPTGALRSADAPVGTDWPAYERSASHSSAIFGDPAVTTANAGSLRAVWSLKAARATHPGQPGPSFDASPTVVGGRVYIGSRTGLFYVVDARTGAVVWTKQLDWGAKGGCGAKGIVGTATVVKDKQAGGRLTVYATGSHDVYALDAATGRQLWKRAVGPDTAAGRKAYFNWGSPTVNNGHVFEGLGANCNDEKVRGGVVELDQHTGVVQGTWYDAPAGRTGATVWSSQAADGTNVWVTTGSPDPAGGAIYDAYSIVRLSQTTMTKQDQWTAPNALDSDLDFGSSPTLFTGSPGGVSTPMVGACSKNGLYYAWRQSDLAAGPVWSVRVGVPGGSPNGDCITSAAWDGRLQNLFVAANFTTVGGVDVQGSLRRLDPTTGAAAWVSPLPCRPTGSPTLNGAVVAVAMYACPSGVAPTVELLRETDGAHLGSVPATGKTFAQPVFAAGHLFVASEDGTLTAYAP